MKITKYSYHVNKMPGNCGAKVLHRLSASYSADPAEDRKRYNTAVESGTLSTIGTPFGDSIRDMLWSIMVAEPKEGTMRCRPIALEWVFAEAVEAATSGDVALLFVSDTHNGAGDGHKGPCAPRHFVEWAIDNDLFEEIGAVTSTRPRTDVEMTGWVMSPNKKRIRKLLNETSKQIQNFIEEANNEPKLKAAKKAREAEEAKARARFQDGWDEFDVGAEDEGPRQGVADEEMLREFVREYARAFIVDATAARPERG